MRRTAYLLLASRASLEPLRTSNLTERLFKKVRIRTEDVVWIEGVFKDTGAGAS